MDCVLPLPVYKTVLKCSLGIGGMSSDCNSLHAPPSQNSITLVVVLYLHSPVEGLAGLLKQCLNFLSQIIPGL